MKFSAEVVKGDEPHIKLNFSEINDRSAYICIYNALPEEKKQSHTSEISLHTKKGYKASLSVGFTTTDEARTFLNRIAFLSKADRVNFESAATEFTQSFAGRVGL